MTDKQEQIRRYDLGYGHGVSGQYKPNQFYYAHQGSKYSQGFNDGYATYKRSQLETLVLGKPNEQVS